ncbi:DUF4837 family protein [Candidatus Neomarinimicrobiota bacterium]
MKIWVLAILIVLPLMQCGYKPPVLGQENIVVIVASEEDQPLLEPLFSDIFSRTLATPAPESYFRVKWVTPIEFEDYKHYKSLIVTSLSNPPDSSGDLLIRRILGSERVTEAMEGGNPIFVASDYLAKGQMFMALSALDAIQAQNEIERLRVWIFDQFEQQLRLRLNDFIYRVRGNKKLTKELEQKYDWRMEVPHDYITVKEKPDRHFVWLGRGFPYRWLSIHWMDQAESITITPEWAWERMEYIADSLFASVYIDTLFRSSELGDENGHNLYILRGVWAHRKETAGGPFFTYVFRDPEQNRIYFLTGIVFNPGGSKNLIIRQQEVVIRTFHTFMGSAAKSKDSSGNQVT